MVNPELGIVVLDFNFIIAIERGSNMSWQYHWDGCCQASDWELGTLGRILQDWIKSSIND